MDPRASLIWPIGEKSVRILFCFCLYIKCYFDRVHSATVLLAKGLAESGNEVTNDLFFDTIKVNPRLDQSEIRLRANERKINLRYYEDGAVGVSLDETTTREDVADLLWVFATPKTLNQVADSVIHPEKLEGSIEASAFRRQSEFLTHPIFNIHHSETELVR